MHTFSVRPRLPRFAPSPSFPRLTEPTRFALAIVAPLQLFALFHTTTCTSTATVQISR